MTNRDTIPPGAVLVALDIAKLRNEVLIEMPGQQRRRRLSVLNNRTEHDRLIDILKAFLITHELQPALAGDTALEGFVPRPTRGAGSWRRDRISG